MIQYNRKSILKIIRKKYYPKLFYECTLVSPDLHIIYDKSVNNQYYSIIVPNDPFNLYKALWRR